MAEPLRDLQVAMDIARVINAVQVTVYPVETVGTTQVLWTARTTLRVAPGQTRVIHALFRDENGVRVGAVDVIAPVGGTDYTVNDRADGTGFDYTHAPSFSLSATIEATRAAITVQNTATGSLYITLLQVRGKPIRVYDPITLEAGDTASQGAYRTRAWALDLPLQADPVFGQAYAEYLVGRFGRPALAADHLQVRNRSLIGGVNVFALGLMDTVIVSDPASGLARAAHRVRAIAGDVTRTGWTITLELERADDRRFCLLDRQGAAELDSQARLGL